MSSPDAGTRVFRSQRWPGVRALMAAWLVLLLSPTLAAQPAHGLRQTTGPVVFEYGWVPATLVARHPAEHAESTMHGGTRGQSGSHIVVALFDKASGARISNATVNVTITALGGASISKALEPMSIDGLASYGGYVPVVQPGIHRIRFEARGPDIAGVASADFEHRVSREGDGR